MNREPTALFAYGTLKRGQLNCSLLTPYAGSIEPGWVQGRLFDMGLFPALAEGEEQVRGELVRVEAASMPDLLSVIDALEGYREDDLPGSMYLRRVVQVTTDAGEREPAYAYFYNREHPGLPALEAFPPIVSGEWLGPSWTVGPAAGAELDAFEEHVRTFRHEVSRTRLPSRSEEV